MTINLTETVGGSPSTEVTIPATVTIAARQRYATFTVTPVADATPDSSITVTITATDTSGSAASGSANVTVVDSLPANSGPGGGDDFRHNFERALNAVFAKWGRGH